MNQMQSTPQPVKYGYRDPRMTELHQEICRALTNNHEFTADSNPMLSADLDLYKSLQRGRLHIECVALPAGLRIDIALDAIGPETALFGKRSCGGFEYLESNEEFFAQPGNGARAIRHIVALLNPADHLIERYKPAR